MHVIKTTQNISSYSIGNMGNGPVQKVEVGESTRHKWINIFGEKKSLQNGRHINIEKTV